MSTIGHNSGLSPEAAAAEMQSALDPYVARKNEFVAKANSVTVENMASAEDAVDFIRMAKALARKARELSDEARAPYDQITATIRNTAQRFIDEVEEAGTRVEERLAAFNRERRRKAAEQKRQQEAEAQALREAAATKNKAKALPDAPVHIEESAPAPKRASPIRTMTGGIASDQKRVQAKVVDVTKVPVSILQTPKVIAAIEQVARPMVQNGITIEGIEAKTHISTTIR